MKKIYKVERMINGEVKQCNINGITNYHELLEKCNSKNDIITINRIPINEYNDFNEENHQFYINTNGDEFELYLNSNKKGLVLSKTGEKTYSVFVKYLVPREKVFPNGETIIQDGVVVFRKGTMKAIEKYADKI